MRLSCEFAVLLGMFVGVSLRATKDVLAQTEPPKQAANRDGVDAYIPQTPGNGYQLPPVLAEYLYISFGKMAPEQKTTVSKQLSEQSASSRQQIVVGLYRSSHNGMSPPALVQSKAKQVLSGYPTSPALNAITSEHSQNGLLFCATWFPGNSRHPNVGNPEWAKECDVLPDGVVLNRFIIWGNGGHFGHSTGTPESYAKKVSATRAMIATLPPGEVHPPLDRLLIVTFRNGKGRETRLYDRSKLPPVIVKFFDESEADHTYFEARPDAAVDAQ